MITAPDDYRIRSNAKLVSDALNGSKGAKVVKVYDKLILQV